MNKKIKYLISTILIISCIVAVSAVSALREPNDYFAFMLGISDLTTSPTDDNALELTYSVAYIPLTGSATYTLTTTPMTTIVNISQPTQINANIKASIVNYAISKGYNIKKIIMQNYNVVNP